MPNIDVHGTKLSFDERGHGETVVLLHSSASSSAQWSKLCEHLADRYRVLALDLYGYGKTDPWTGRRSLRLADEAALVAALLPRTARCHLVGHSYGGAVALRLAAERPERLRSLTLIEPVAFHVLAGADAADHALLDGVNEVAGAVRRALDTGDYWAGMARFIDFWNGPGAWACLSDETRAHLGRCVAKIALDFWAVINEETPLEAYRRLDIPALVLSGLGSPLATLRIAELLAETMPRARLAMVGGAGHMLPLTHPEIVNPAIARHLEEAKRGPYDAGRVRQAA